MSSSLKVAISLAIAYLRGVGEKALAEAGRAAAYPSGALAPDAWMRAEALAPTRSVFAVVALASAIGMSAASIALSRLITCRWSSGAQEADCLRGNWVSLDLWILEARAELRDLGFRVFLKGPQGFR